MKWIMVLLGLGLAMVGAAAIDRGVTWLGWLDLFAATMAVLAGVTVRAYPSLRSAPIAIGFVVCAIGLVGFGRHAPPTIAAWTLAFGVALVLDGVIGVRSSPRRYA